MEAYTRGGVGKGIGFISNASSEYISLASLKPLDMGSFRVSKSGIRGFRFDEYGFMNVLEDSEFISNISSEYLWLEEIRIPCISVHFEISIPESVFAGLLRYSVGMQ